MDQQELADALALLAGRKWLPFFVIAIGWVVRLLSDKSRFPAEVPARWQPVVVLALSVAYSAVTAVSSGATWKAAAIHSFVVAFVVMGAFDLLVKAVWNGREPAWVGWLVLVFRKPNPPQDPPPSGTP